MIDSAPLPKYGFLAGRCLMAVVYFYSAIVKLVDGDAARAEFDMFGLPYFLILPTIILQLSCAIGLVSGILLRPAAITLALFTLAATLIVHDFWTYPAEARGMQTIIFLEHLAIIGGLIVVAAIPARGGR